MCQNYTDLIARSIEIYLSSVNQLHRAAALQNNLIVTPLSLAPH